MEIPVKDCFTTALVVIIIIIIGVEAAGGRIASLLSAPHGAAHGHQKGEAHPIG